MMGLFYHHNLEHQFNFGYHKRGDHTNQKIYCGHPNNVFNKTFGRPAKYLLLK